MSGYTVHRGGVADTLLEQLGLPAGTPVLEWVTGWPVNGGAAPAGADPSGQLVDAELTAALSGFTATAGRGDPFGNVETSTCTVQLVQQLLGQPAIRTPRVGERFRLAVGRQVADALGLSLESRCRFTGEVTGRRLIDGVLTIAASGRRARLGRLPVGDEPWPAETDGARARRILELAQAQLGDLELGLIDAGTVQVLGRDVDRQQALGLLEKLADTAAGQLVERRTGALEWHDAEHRRNLAPTVELQAGPELLAGLTWSSGVAGMVNTLRLVYGTAPAGSSERPVVDYTDVAAAGPTGVGPISASLDTDLAQLEQARERVRLTVARRSAESWEMPALGLDLMRTARSKLVQLLELEHGHVARVTGLPTLNPYTTGQLAVEGVTEVLTRTAWRLELALAELGIAGAPVRWADLDPSLTWADLDPSLTWLAAGRWQPDPAPRGRWLDQPADLTWADLDPSLTWATYPTT